MGNVLYTRKRERSRRASEARWGGRGVGGTESQKEGGKAKGGAEKGKAPGTGYATCARAVA